MYLDYHDFHEKSTMKIKCDELTTRKKQIADVTYQVIGFRFGLEMRINN